MKTRPYSSLLISTLVSGVLWFSTVHGQEIKTNNSSLPELGDRATQYLSARQEKEIGQSFLRQLIRDPNYLDDPELRYYLQSIGDRIAQFTDLRGTKLTFNFVSSLDLNAFAVPGGYITFNTGLLLQTQEESELASVVAHEIAHISQLHLPRLIARSQQNKLPTAAAIIGSILLGGQVGLAGLTLTNAQLISNQLRYTRDFENEADAIGLQLLTRSGFDPRAMAQFFNTLDRYSRTQSTLPEFLRTHPLSYNRIASTQARAAQVNSPKQQSSLDFFLARAKVHALHIPDRANPEDHFKNYGIQSENKDKALQQIANRYGLAIALFEEDNYESAHATLAPLIEAHSDNRFFQILQARIEQAAGSSDKAIQRLTKLREQHPQINFIDDYLIEALIDGNQLDLAKKRIRYRLRREPENYELYEKLSRTNVKLDLIAEAHQADAEYHASLGDTNQAISALKLALRDGPKEGYFKESVSAKLRELEEKRRLEKKQN